MIYTFTINPSLDYVMEMDQFSVGKMNRSKRTYLLPGGKGINVSQVLNNLGVPNAAILPVAGFTGEKLLSMLSEKDIHYDALHLEQGNTRINVKVLGQEETELNAGGPEMYEWEIKELVLKTEKLSDGDWLVLSGSVPEKLGEHFYADILKRVEGRNVKVVVDTIGDNFLNALPYKPFLVKPNREELESIFDRKADTKEEIIELATKLQRLGANNVLVSLGEDGAILLTGDGQVLDAGAPEGVVINTVGSGDSMVAGFVSSFAKEGVYETALKWGIAAGSASAFSKNLATKEEIDARFKIL